MKLKLLFIGLSLFLFSCASNTLSTETAPLTPIDNVLNDFATRYPSVTDVQWTFANNYQKVSFTKNNLPCSAWYDNINGNWIVSYLSAPTDQIPQAIKNYILTTISSDIVAVDTLMQRNMDNLFVVNMGSSGIYTFTAEGYLQQQVDKQITTLPNSILMYINAYYDQSAFMGGYVNLTTTTVNIIDNDIMKTLLFDQQYHLLWITWYISPSNLPEAVKTVLASDNYSSYYIYKSIYKIDSSSQFYEIILMKEGSAGMVLKFNADGTIVAS